VNVSPQYRTRALAVAGWVTTAFTLILVGLTLLVVVSAHELAIGASASFSSPARSPPNFSYKKPINALQNSTKSVS